MTEYVRRINPEHADNFCNTSSLFKQLDMELTERCNLECIHCYINQAAHDQSVQTREMDTEKIKSILGEAVELDYLSVRFTGGEPLLRPDFPEIYLHARKLGLRVVLFTNATLITPYLANLFARTPPLERISITVYGMSQDSYYRITGRRSAYSTAMQGIKLLQNRRIPFTVKTVILPDNRHELATFENWAATLPWMSGVPGKVVALNLRARRDKPDKQKLIEKIRLAPAEAVSILNRDRTGYRAGLKAFSARFLGVTGKKLFTCGAGLNGSVDAYGRMQPCLLLRHPDCTWDLNQHSMRRVLTDFFPGLHRRQAVNPEYLARCGKCFLRGFCEQCPAKSWMEYGTLDTPIPYLCAVAHQQARDIGLLADKEQAWEVEDWQQRITFKDTQDNHVIKTGEEK